MLCEFKREGCKAAFVFAEEDAVDPDSGSSHGTFEINEDTLACGGLRQFEAAPIGGDEFVILVVEVVPGQVDVGMRNNDAFKLRIVEIRRLQHQLLLRVCSASSYSMGRIILPDAICSSESA